MDTDRRKQGNAETVLPRIVVFGVGGAGGNAVNNMIEAGVEGVEFVAANTDAQHLALSRAPHKIQLGTVATQGLGAGAQPQIGATAAEESAEAILEVLAGAHMVFITAGMGGGTGTGAGPVIARCARERGILTVGVVTKPFSFEGRHRMRLADAGIQELERYTDTLIIVPNQNLFRIANDGTTFAEAFRMADEVLHSGVRSVTDLIVLPGLINLDFADVLAIMAGMGPAMMGSGEATGENRAIIAAEQAVENPLLDVSALNGAKAVLLNVTGGLDLTLHELDLAADHIASQVHPDANIIFGAAYQPALEGRIRVSVIATGMVKPPQAAAPAAAPILSPAQAPAPAPGPDPGPPATPEALAAATAPVVPERPEPSAWPQRSEWSEQSATPAPQSLDIPEPELPFRAGSPQRIARPEPLRSEFPPMLRRPAPLTAPPPRRGWLWPRSK